MEVEGNLARAPHPANPHLKIEIWGIRLKLPIDRVMPLKEAGEAQAIGEKGGGGKIVLTA